MTAPREGAAPSPASPDPSWPPGVPDRLSAPRAIEPSRAHLLGRLALLERRVRHAVDRRRETDRDPDDRFRGLYLSDADVDALLAGGGRLARADADEVADALAHLEAAADAAEAAGAAIRLRDLARRFGLTPAEVDLVLVALAPDVDARFERLYAYLQDDVTRRRAGIGLAIELLADPATDTELRSAVRSGATLLEAGLLLVDERDRPFLTRSLRVPDRVTAFLLGDDRPDRDVARLVEVLPPAATGGEAITRSRAAGARLWYLHEAVVGAGTGIAAAGLAADGGRVLNVDLGRLEPGDDAAAIIGAVIREAELLGASLVAGPVDGLAETARGVLRLLVEARTPVALRGTRTWDPAWGREVPVLVEAALTPEAERALLWAEALDATGSASSADRAAADEATRAFRLTPRQITRAARAAGLAASADGRTLAPEHVQAGARAQNAAGLERLARRIAPAATWDDLVLPPRTRAQLADLLNRAHNREHVLRGWGMGAGPNRGSGLTALFAGDSGTGKTLSAEVLASGLGLDLYLIDLSTVVDKYIGETEKNLDKIFAEADRVNGVLLFDEADAIFGKRSEVKDARDRYANVEIAYLLQRMERFDGLAVLTTNLRANLDEAFLRRLDVIVDFPLPDEEERLRLWRLHLRPGLPVADDIDLGFLAAQFRISGGSIRNVCVTAAYLAAADRRPVTMGDLVRATEREYDKLGRLTVASEFGAWFGSLAEVAEPG